MGRWLRLIPRRAAVTEASPRILSPVLISRSASLRGFSRKVNPRGIKEPRRS